MDEQQVREAVLGELAAIAPEVDVAALQPAVLLRTQVDLDSYDWLQFLVALHTRLQVDIPESDYAKLATVDQIVAYLRTRLPG